MGISTVREISLGNHLGEVVVKANGASIQIHPDGSLDTFTNEAVRAHPANSESDLRWIGSWRNHKIVFKLSLVAVKKEIHARIHLLRARLRIKRNFRLPLRGIVSDQVVHFAGKLAAARHGRRRIRSHQLHSNHASARCLRCAQRISERPKRAGPRGNLRLRFRKDCFRGRQQQRVALAPRHELNSRVRLPPIRLKKERKVNRLWSHA